jgi:hypothetical protein
MNKGRLAAFAVAAVWGSVSASVIESDFASGTLLSSGGGSVIDAADGLTWVPPNPGWHLPGSFRYGTRAEKARLPLPLPPLYPQREHQCGTFPGEHVRAICYPRDGMLWFDQQP